MRLEAIELFRTDLVFREPVGTAAGVHRTRPVAFVRVATDVAEGFGECAALAEGTSVDPPFDALWRALSDIGVPRILDASAARGGALPPASQVGALFGSSPVAHALGATLEMALLDAELHEAHQPLWARLGADPDAAARGVPVGRLVGIPADRSIATLVEAVRARVAHAARVRIKIEPRWDVAPLRALRCAFPDLALQADANGSYRLDADGPADAGRLGQLDDLGLVCIEQPLAPADLVALAELASRIRTPVCLDESLTSLGRVRDALRYGACGVGCIKPARVGGLLRARRAAAILAAAGVPAFVGGFFETGFARTANVALAGVRGFTLPGDLSDPAEYLDGEPVVPYEGVEGARVRPYGGPGIAPAPTLGRPACSWRL